MSDAERKLSQAVVLLKTVLAHFSWREAADESYDDFGPSQLTVDMQQDELIKPIRKFLEASA